MSINRDEQIDVVGDKIILEGGTDGTLVGNLGDKSKTADVIDQAGVQESLTVGTTAVEAKVGASPLSGRTLLSVQPLDNSVYYGFTSGVTTANGTRIFKNQTVWFDISENSSVYLVANGAGKDVRVTEA